MAIIQLTYSPPAKPEPVSLPLSKSIALRAMVLNRVSETLGHGTAIIPALPDAEDVQGMQRALDAIKPETGHNTQKTVYIGEGGAPLRFFTALASSLPGTDITVSASKSLMRRPLSLLIDALHEAGADISCLRKEGYPPLHIIGKNLSPSSLSLNPSVSSQFISALMLASPLWEQGLNLSFGGSTPVSMPYIQMTASMMRTFGAEVEVSETTVKTTPGKCTAPQYYCIEPDWSAASYFYELALLRPGIEIPIEALTPPEQSLQGDAACAAIFSLLGVETRIDPVTGVAVLRCNPEHLEVFRQAGQPLELDLNGTPDLVPALAVGFCLAGVRFRFLNVAHLRHKETNRMSALQEELAKLGYSLECSQNEMAWLGRRLPEAHDAVETYSDHRMAMAFAVAAAALPYIAIQDPEVTAKSYPAFWDNLQRLGFSITKPGTRSLNA